MDIVNRAGRTLKWFVFGSANLRQQCAIGLRDPQTEVSVWLCGLGAPRDVTYNHVMAAARPLTLGIGFESQRDAAIIRRSRPSLQFRERRGEQRVLGEISLQPTEAIPVRGEYLHLFETRSYRNYCLPGFRLWALYLFYEYRRWRAGRRTDASGFRMVVRELHTVFVFYICPRPVVLVSVTDGNFANIFPMDLIGPIGTRHFSLALHRTSTAVPLIENSRRVALSNVPVEQTAVAYELGKNHKKPSVDWADVPFATTLSATFRLPVPRFSLRVREMRIEAVRDLGSHKLFLAEYRVCCEFGSTGTKTGDWL
jgi:flavin reductase (DIM6/NTAB) family NADH-FMN oxidoreductase RutF